MELKSSFRISLPGLFIVFEDFIDSLPLLRFETFTIFRSFLFEILTSRDFTTV